MQNPHFAAHAGSYAKHGAQKLMTYIVVEMNHGCGNLEALQDPHSQHKDFCESQNILFK